MCSLAVLCGPSAAGSHSPPALSTAPGERRTERRPDHSRPPLKTTRAAKSADDVIRKARAAQRALVARGQFGSARKLGEAADLLAGLAELPEERGEPGTMPR